MRDDQGVNLSITYGDLKLKRILKINGTKLASIKSQYGPTTETIQFDGDLPSLPNSVKVYDAGSYFIEGIYTNSNITCAKANAQYTIEPGNTTDSLKFTLTLNQLDRKEVIGCIPPLFSPTPETYEFTLTSDGLELNAVEATLKGFGIIRLVF
jgi:hypothetical protein